MNETITIPLAEYERLKRADQKLKELEERDESEAVSTWRADPKQGMPDAFVTRLIDGEAPLRVLRDWRGLSQSALARNSGVNRVQIADIEAGRKTGSVATLMRLAQALGVTLDDLV